KRSTDEAGSLFNRGGDLPRDIRDARGRAQRVGGHRHREPALDRSARQMRPEALVERTPETAMHEDDQTLGSTFRQKKIEAIARPLAIDDIKPCAALAAKGIAIGLRLRHPCRWPAVAPGDVRTIGLGVVPVVYPLKNHAI